jgi:hypothetical protein
MLRQQADPTPDLGPECHEAVGTLRRVKGHLVCLECSQWLEMEEDRRREELDLARRTFGGSRTWA